METSIRWEFFSNAFLFCINELYCTTFPTFEKRLDSVCVDDIYEGCVGGIEVGRCSVDVRKSYRRKERPSWVYSCQIKEFLFRVVSKFKRTFYFTEITRDTPDVLIFLLLNPIPRKAAQLCSERVSCFKKFVDRTVLLLIGLKFLYKMYKIKYNIEASLTNQMDVVVRQALFG